MELPFKLLIMMLLIGLVVPTVLIGYRGVSRMRYDDKIKGEVRDIIAYSRKLVQEGDMSSMTIELDLKGDVFSGIDYLDVGDSLGERDWMVNYRLSWKESEEYISAIDPVIHLTSPDNETYRLTEGIHELKLTHIFNEETSFIVMSEVGEDIDPSRFN